MTNFEKIVEEVNNYSVDEFASFLTSIYVTAKAEEQGIIPETNHESRLNWLKDEAKHTGVFLKSVAVKKYNS